MEADHTCAWRSQLLTQSDYGVCRLRKPERIFKDGKNYGNFLFLDKHRFFVVVVVGWDSLFFFVFSCRVINQFYSKVNLLIRKRSATGKFLSPEHRFGSGNVCEMMKIDGFVCEKLTDWFSWGIGESTFLCRSVFFEFLIDLVFVWNKPIWLTENPKQRIKPWWKKFHKRSL